MQLKFRYSGKRWVGAAVPVTTTLLAMGGVALLACGPDFPNMLLTQGENAVLVAPVAVFSQEIGRMHLEKSPYVYKAPPEAGDASTVAETSDLAEALRARGLDEEAASRRIERHTAERFKLANAAQEILIDPELPAEFADYFSGAIWWQRARQESGEFTPQDCLQKACAAWTEVLSLPAAERKYKSTWAEYMLGIAARSLTNVPAEQALAHFRNVRALVDQGFSDSLGLAAASYGLEAQIYLQQKAFGRAIDLYLLQAATGDPTAIESLRITAAQALDPENQDTLKLLVREPNARRVITTQLVARRNWLAEGAEDHALVNRWLGLLESEDIRDLELAEQLAFAAYQAGEMDLARRWLDRAANDSFGARWLRAKLLFYEGDVDKAAKALSALAREFPVAAEASSTAPQGFGENLVIPFQPLSHVSARAQVHGEAGTLHLARREFTEALDALLRGGFWMDAAYVAERVLTAPELTEYVDVQWAPQAQENPAPATPEGFDDRMMDSARIRVELRYLLARRLARLHQEIKARPYYPAEWQAKLDELVALRRASDDATQPARERAHKLFQAAHIMRENGMELYGTETAPDWQAYGGNFTEGVTAETRAEIQPPDRLRPTREELARANLHIPEPDRRFHYRYLAAEIAFQAAKLLPDNDHETALILCTAGSWLKDRDPKAADKYYKTLVRRCRKTKIGHEADKLRWFPLIDENGKILPRPVAAPPFEPPPPPPDLPMDFPVALR